MARTARAAIVVVVGLAGAMSRPAQAGTDDGVPVRVALTATASASSDDTAVAAALDGDPTTSWCTTAKGTLMVRLPAALQDVQVTIYRDDDQTLLVRGEGYRKSTELTGVGALVFQFDHAVRWIEIQPRAKDGGGGCLRDVEVWTLDVAYRKYLTDSELLAAMRPGARRPVVSLSPRVRMTRAPRDVVTREALARAPDMIRALRLALEDCDTEYLQWWVAYPLTAGGDIYPDARAHRAACLHRDVTAVAPSAPALAAELTTMRADAAGDITLAPSDSGVTWHLEWRHGQWWLVSID